MILVGPIQLGILCDSGLHGGSEQPGVPRGKGAQTRYSLRFQELEFQDLITP